MPRSSLQPEALTLTAGISLGRDTPVTGRPRTARPSVMSDLAELAKTRITAMVVLTAYLGYVMGQDAAYPGVSPHARPGHLFLTLLGTALSCIGAGILNQIYERRTDALMRRTADRPLPAGRISPALALPLGLGSAIVGVALLAALAGTLAAGLSAFTIVTYTLLYTPLKRLSHTATIVGAVPGAMPPLIGYAAAAHALSFEAWVVFAIMFIWQLPHFLAIAWLYRDDYARAAFPLLPVIDPTGDSTFRQILASCLALLPLGILPAMLGVCGTLYLWGALIAGIAFLGMAVNLITRRSRAAARSLFFASLLYLPVVLALLAFDRT